MRSELEQLTNFQIFDLKHLKYEAKSILAAVLLAVTSALKV